jgi:hypothetical protein
MTHERYSQTWMCDAESSTFKHGACHLLTKRDVDSTFSTLYHIHTDKTMSMYHMQNPASSYSLQCWPRHNAGDDRHVSGIYSNAVTPAWKRLTRYLHWRTMLTTKWQTPDSLCVPSTQMETLKRQQWGLLNYYVGKHSRFMWPTLHKCYFSQVQIS